MHARSCLTLLAVASLAIASPTPDPEPAPIDKGIANSISSNLNMACQNGCDAASSAQQLDTNAALGSAVNPLSVVGGVVLAGSVLVAL